MRIGVVRATATAIAILTAIPAAAATHTATTGVSAAAPIRFAPVEVRLGDPVVVYVHCTDGSITRARGEVFDYHIELIRISQDSLRGVIGVPMDIPPKRYRFTVRVGGDERIGWLVVRDRPWNESKLHVSKRFTAKKRSKQLRRRIKREQLAWEAMWAPGATRPKFNGTIVRPVPGVVTAVFGTKRIFNAQKRTRHYGLDLEAKTGDPIVASQAGRVVMSAMRFTSGGTVVLDHGHGLFTAYFHMSERDVKAGDWVRAGDDLGAAGRTGRVTGPHLHLAVLVRMEQAMPKGALRRRALYVEPEAFLQLRFDGEDSHLDEGPEFLGNSADTARAETPTPARRR